MIMSLEINIQQWCTCKWWNISRLYNEVRVLQTFKMAPNALVSFYIDVVNQLFAIKFNRHRY